MLTRNTKFENVLRSFGKERRCFGTRQLKDAETGERAPLLPKKTLNREETQRRNDQDFSKIARSKKRNFRPRRNERAGSREPTLTLSNVLVRHEKFF